MNANEYIDDALELLELALENIECITHPNVILQTVQMDTTQAINDAINDLNKLLKLGV